MSNKAHFTPAQRGRVHPANRKRFRAAFLNYIMFRPQRPLSHRSPVLPQLAGVYSQPRAANCQRGGEPGHEGTAGSGHLQHHAGHEVSGRHARPLGAPGLPDAAGQHPAAAAAGPAQPGVSAGNTPTSAQCTCFCSFPALSDRPPCIAQAFTDARACSCSKEPTRTTSTVGTLLSLTCRHH